MTYVNRFRLCRAAALGARKMHNPSKDRLEDSLVKSIEISKRFLTGDEDNPYLDGLPILASKKVGS